ncbi:fibronectin type III domain-containing protein [Streptomyces sp. NPDC050145]|uniref:fibronectin type III domain-containing protein n=1 Tax=Streptomyces sp. NPDC050145 TaxID=3365602 RepID=UPI0037BC730A
MHKKRTGAVAVAGALSVAAVGGLLAVAPQAAAATTCSTNVYQRSFYKNTTFSGTPVKTDCDSAISQNWGTGSPATGVPTNNFGVRWSVTRDFGSGGPFTFNVSATDGVRVYLDGVRKIDLWQGTGDTARSKSLNLTVPSGKHTLRVDYVNWTGAAKVAYTYAPRTSATYDSVKPLAPTGVKTAYDTTTRRTTVSWAANKEMDLAGYSLYRREAREGSSWTKVASTTTGRSYTDPLVNPDDRTPYYYEVRAKDKAGNTSSGSADTIVRPVPTATGMTGAYDPTTRRVSLKWTQNTEAHFDHYTVMSNEMIDGRGTWVAIGTTKGNTWTTDPVVADGEANQYKVIVTNDGGTTEYVGNGSLNAYAENEVWLNIPDQIGPYYAPDLALDRCDAGVWVAASDSTPAPIRDFAGFQVERRLAGTEAWTVVLHKGYDPRQTTATASVCDPLPVDGSVYEYRAFTYDSAGNLSPATDIQKIRVDDISYPTGG